MLIEVYYNYCFLKLDIYSEREIINILKNLLCLCFEYLLYIFKKTLKKKENLNV